MTVAVAIVAVDVGSVRQGNFGWYLSAPAHVRKGDRPEGLLDALHGHLRLGGVVALGFECPLWIPIPPDADGLGRARPGEGNRAWSASPGATALATGAQQAAWVLHELGSRHGDSLHPTLTYGDLAAGRSRLLVWEAFVSGGGKAEWAEGSVHINDARLAVEEFARRTAAEPFVSDCPPSSDVFSLAGAALLSAGLSGQVELLGRAPMVVKVQDQGRVPDAAQTGPFGRMEGNSEHPR